mgnify:CR=1 FL=1
MKEFLSIFSLIYKKGIKSNMCGIIGYLGSKNAKNIIIKGLKRLEYRGYDSAGIATIVDGEIDEQYPVWTFNKESNLLSLDCNIGDETFNLFKYKK